MSSYNKSDFEVQLESKDIVDRVFAPTNEEVSKKVKQSTTTNYNIVEQVKNVKEPKRVIGSKFTSSCIESNKVNDVSNIGLFGKELKKKQSLPKEPNKFYIIGSKVSVIEGLTIKLECINGYNRLDLVGFTPLYELCIKTDFTELPLLAGAVRSFECKNTNYILLKVDRFEKDEVIVININDERFVFAFKELNVTLDYLDLNVYSIKPLLLIKS